MLIFAHLFFLGFFEHILHHLIEVDIDISVLVGLCVEDSARGVILDDDIQEIIEFVVGELLLKILWKIVADKFNLACIFLCVHKDFVVDCCHR